MKHPRPLLNVLLIASVLATPGGCRLHQGQDFAACVPEGCYEQVASEIDYPAESGCTDCLDGELFGAVQPRTVLTDAPPEYWDVPLEEVIQLALSNSRVLRDLGGAVVKAPGATQTTWDAAIAETDPRSGVEAALAAFDAQFTTSLFFEENDRALNNVFFGGGTRLLQQDASVFQAQITKRAVTGSEFTLRHNVDYDANNAPGNVFSSAWNTNIEAEIRHPLLQGSGTQFNRIAGPSRTPGEYNGVLIARINQDVALSDFEVAVRDMVSNLENAYWDLYFGYRDLDSKIAARDAALDTWRKIYALYESGRRGGEAEKEAQSREQFFRFQEEVQNGLSGQLLDGTRTGNGSSGGTFRASGGVLVAERRLRLLIGLPPSDGRLLRPSDEPAMVKINFDWDQAVAEASTRRAELRRQKWQIRRRELELIASKNHLLPRLDMVGRYRFRGFGDDLLGSNEVTPIGFENSYDNLASGDFQEWQLGIELSVPIGYRRAHAATRHAELRLSRERALLSDQQRQVIHEVADAIAEMDRVFIVSQTSYNRLVASRQQLGAVQAAYEADKAPLDLFLDAQRRVAEGESRYYRSLAEYAVAAKNVHFVKGTLLEYDGIYLAEGAWPSKAHVDAARLEADRSDPRPLNYASSKAPVVSRGPFPQVREHATSLPANSFYVEELEEMPAPAPALAPAPVPSPRMSDESMPDESMSDESGSLNNPFRDE